VIKVSASGQPRHWAKKISRFLLIYRLRAPKVELGVDFYDLAVISTLFIVATSGKTPKYPAKMILIDYQAAMRLIKPEYISK